VSQPLPVHVLCGEDKRSFSATTNLPQHIAIIMDGNGRWAQARNLPRIVGHNYGAEAVRRTVRGAAELGVRYLTLFGFSSENWKRPNGEVEDLMNLLRRYLHREIDDLHNNGVRFSVIGKRSQLGSDICALIDAAERRTAGNEGLHLTVALSYGGRAEIMDAVQRALQLAATGSIKPEDLTESYFSTLLSTAKTPDPDLVIRTSGEKRLSNFLLWQSAYSEFVFLDKHWPDFGIDDLKAAIAEYSNRNRRYGTVG